MLLLKCCKSLAIFIKVAHSKTQYSCYILIETVAPGIGWGWEEDSSYSQALQYPRPQAKRAHMEAILRDEGKVHRLPLNFLKLPT